MELTKSIFFEKHNVTTRDVEVYLNEALSRGGDYADLYFEYRINHSIVLEEQIIKSATKGVNLGVGVRVISGEKTGYAYSDDLNRANVPTCETRWQTSGWKYSGPDAAKSGTKSLLHSGISGRIRDCPKNRPSGTSGSSRARIRCSHQTSAGELR